MSYFSYSLRCFVWCDFILLFLIAILLITSPFFSYLIYAFCLCLIHSCVDLLFMHYVISFISLYLFIFFIILILHSTMVFALFLLFHPHLQDFVYLRYLRLLLYLLYIFMIHWLCRPISILYLSTSFPIRLVLQSVYISASIPSTTSFISYVNLSACLIRAAIYIYIWASAGCRILGYIALQYSSMLYLVHAPLLVLCSI